MSWDVCGAVMIIGRHISSAKERHFFLQKSCFVFSCPFREKIKCLSKSQTSCRVHKAVIHIFPWYKKDYRAVVCICRKKVWSAKPQLGFKMAHVVSDTESKENIWPILFEDSHLTNRDEEKAEIFNAIFASVFNNTDRPWASLSQRTTSVGTVTFHLRTLQL